MSKIKKAKEKIDNIIKEMSIEEIDRRIEEDKQQSIRRR